MKTANKPLLFILAAYLFAAFAYGIVNPQFEGPDEHFHYFTAEQIGQTWRLPSVPQPPFKFPFVATNDAEFLGQEAAQPPLYYILMAPVIALFDTDQSQEITTFNPHAALGDASFPSNKNGFVHGPWETFPGRGHVAAVYTVRAISALIGLATILCIYAAARTFWPDHPNRALLAAGLVGTLPQFTFQHSLVSNDGLITLLVTFSLLLLIRLELAPHPTQTAWRFVQLGAVIGLAILTKNQGAVLLLFVLGVLVVRGFGRDSLLAIGRKIALVTVPALLIGAWLWVRNVQLYGDWSAANQFVAIAGGDRQASLLQVLGESSGLWRSFIAVFGWMTVAAPQWVYAVWVILAGLALLGLILFGRSHRWDQGDNRPLLLSFISHPAVLLFGWLLLVYAALVAFMMQTVAAQGRLLFPAILPIALAVSFGLSLWQPFGDQAKSAKVLILIGVLFAINLFALGGVIRPAFAQPTVTTETSEEILAQWPSGVELVQAGPPTSVARPGDWIDVPLTWRTPKAIQPDDRPELVMELLGVDDALIGKFHGYHGRGLYPADLWTPNDAVSDVEHLFIFPESADHQPDLPVLARLFAHPVDEDPGYEVGTVKVIPADWPLRDEGEVVATLGDKIGLISAGVSQLSGAPGDTVTVQVEWFVIDNELGDYTTFIHLGRADAAPLATGDQKPRGGHYPTHVWQAGERFSDSYTFVVPDAPAGSYPLRLGMYDAASATFDRLPVQVSGQTGTSDGFFIVDFEIK